MHTEELSYNMYLHWAILNECNYSCNYCNASPRKGVPDNIDIPKVIRRLEELNTTALITFTGGEPFLVPNFVEFAHEVTKKHYIRIDTNLSLTKSCERFLNLIDPNRVFEITFSVHILERMKRKHEMSELSILVKRFQEKGFNIVGSYVVYPPLLGRIENDVNFFKTQGIEIRPTLYIGKFDEKNYPLTRDACTYSDNEMNLISRLNPNAKTKIDKRKNLPCQAGTSAFFITPDYDVFPCITIRRKLGNFFDEWKTFSKVIRCSVDYCFCPFNRPFSTSLATQQHIQLLQKTMSEKGVFSILESRLFVTGLYPWLLDILPHLLYRLRIRRGISQGLLKKKFL